MTRRRHATWLASIWVASAVVAGPVLMADMGCAQQSPAELAGYRQDSYQGSTPATLNGAPALTTDQVKALWAAKSAIFIDVLPHAPKPAGLPEGTIWQEKPHRSVRGALWLPDVGRGTLAPETEAYFKRSLAELTSQDQARPLVIFCKRNCWMSWNAAKRAESYGYTHVLWFADGIDGWTDATLPMETVEPRA